MDRSLPHVVTWPYAELADRVRAHIQISTKVVRRITGHLHVDKTAAGSLLARLAVLFSWWGRCQGVRALMDRLRFWARWRRRLGSANESVRGPRSEPPVL